MKIEHIKTTTKETVDELSKAAKAHVDLVKTQYKEYSTRHGDPVDRLAKAVREPVAKTRSLVTELSKDVTAKTEEVVKMASEALPARNKSKTTATGAKTPKKTGSGSSSSGEN